MTAGFVDISKGEADAEYECIGGKLKVVGRVAQTTIGSAQVTNLQVSLLFGKLHVMEFQGNLTGAIDIGELFPRGEGDG